MILGNSIPDTSISARYFPAGALVSDDLTLGLEPREHTRVQWPPGAQTIATTLDIVTMGWGGFLPRVGALLSLSGVPVGLKVVVVGIDLDGNIVDLGGNSQTQRTVRMVDGSIGLYWLFGIGLPQLDGYIVSFYNDVSGHTYFAANALFEIGFLNLAPGATLPHEPSGDFGRTPIRKMVRKLGGGVSSTTQTSYRTMSVRPSASLVAKARANGLDNGMDYESLLFVLANNPYVLVIEDTSSADAIQRSGMFGICANSPSMTRRARPSFQMGVLDLEEIPP
jgi:hypothetical protein